MILFPHAKINLGLDIVARRADGYHDIETVMMPAGWEDVLELTPSDRRHSSLSVSGRTVQCPPEKNLVMKAFRAMEAATGGLPPTDIRLHKVIPDGAGLGGGSADAAFTLRGLNELYNVGMTETQLCRIAASIGADCPFFIADRPMLCTGTGTDMTPVSLPDFSGLTLAIVKPPVSVNTAAAYSRVTPHRPEVPLAQRIAAPIDRWQDSIVNDFEQSVFPQFPEIARTKELMLGAGALYAAMSGSGSAVFGLFEGMTTDILSDRMNLTFPGCPLYCRSL
ncbi:MAG: 4-(cytidine 5'-diphospho)-2-C-methyl-D-erythritol kinase [Muribaculaceae bacterium]|nr:4-(cytidine 5'-diphospho)-2-C-methyl-D-erythritol kinase [Muribaculaceae bacterium]